MIFDQSTKWYKHKSVSVPKSDIDYILWDFEIQTDNPIATRKPDLVLINQQDYIS